MAKSNIVDPGEIQAYEEVRQRLRRMAEKRPEILDISIALAGRQCPQCSDANVAEIPGIGFYCRSCSHEWGRTLIKRGY